jgi:hypothetical protein
MEEIQPEISEKNDKEELNKEEIQKALKSNIIKIFNQIKKGCSRNICFNIFCAKNLLCQKSN